MTWDSRIRLGSGQRTQLEISALIVAITLLIFYIDVITPLGLTIWILYFVPLSSTIYLEWKYAPITGAVFAIILLAISFFFSPRDISEFFAIIDRIFFSAMLIVTAVLITRYNQSMEALIESEERYRTIAEWSPDAILVQRGKMILYANRAALSLFGANRNEDVLGRDIVLFVHSDERVTIRQKMDQALMGAKMQVPRIAFVRVDGKEFLADAWFGEIVWDGNPAVHIILRAQSGS
jgi:PAS domain S-box-containing protein